MKKELFLRRALEDRKKIGNVRSLPQGRDHLVDFSSNDYLGFARSKDLSKQIEDEFTQFSDFNGSTGSRLLTGNHSYTEQLEKEIASFHRAPASLIFNSGYVANCGLLSCVAGKKDCILVDADVHASTWDGARLSQAQILLFKHNDLSSLKEISCIAEIA